MTTETALQIFATLARKRVAEREADGRNVHFVNERDEQDREIKTMSDKQPKAIIFVDGEEFMRVWGDSDEDALFYGTVERVGGEVARMVWKPRYGVYFRERLSITGAR